MRPSGAACKDFDGVNDDAKDDQAEGNLKSQRSDSNQHASPANAAQQEQHTQSNAKHSLVKHVLIAGGSHSDERTYGKFVDGFGSVDDSGDQFLDEVHGYSPEYCVGIRQLKLRIRSIPFPIHAKDIYLKKSIAIQVAA